jgi:hypothetical protein
MHHQRIAAFLLGALILGSLFMIFVAIQNFGMADRLGTPETHAALHDMAGRLNQVFFVAWERAELLLGVALVAFLAFGTRNRLQASVAGAVLVLVAVQHFFVTPQMISLTAHLNEPTYANQFARLHGIYGVMEVVKLLMAFALAIFLLPSWGRRGGDRGVQVQTVDYAHHGHVDG